MISTIFNIQRFSTHDGRGIRATVFFKGCSLICPWCSNPESQSSLPEIFFDPTKCILCKECIQKSDNQEFVLENVQIYFRKELLENVRQWSNICPAKAILVKGREYTPDEVFHEINKDISYYKTSHGGVTFSGGEPLLHTEFLIDLSKKLKSGSIPVTVETCLYVPWEKIAAILPYVDCFLVDYKHADREKLKKYTGAELELINNNLNNLTKLKNEKPQIIIRIPVIPEFNHSLSEIFQIIDYIKVFPKIKEIHFLPFHNLGAGKYKLLNRKYLFSKPGVQDDELKKYISYAEKNGLESNIGG